MHPIYNIHCTRLYNACKVNNCGFLSFKVRLIKAV